MRTISVHAACRPGRHLRLEPSAPQDAVGCEEFLAGGASEFYTIPGEWVRPTHRSAAPGERRKYDTELGCPQSIYHGVRGWKPDLYVYDGDTRVAKVDADYTLWELNGRFDYGFSATQQEV